MTVTTRTTTTTLATRRSRFELFSLCYFLFSHKLVISFRLVSFLHFHHHHHHFTKQFRIISSSLHQSSEYQFDQVSNNNKSNNNNNNNVQKNFSSTVTPNKKSNDNIDLGDQHIEVNKDGDVMNFLERESLVQYNRKVLRQAEEQHQLLYQLHKEQTRNQRRRRRQEQQQQQGQQQQQRHYSLIQELLEISRLSFINVEQMSEDLFSRQPLIAFSIFIICGLLISYLLGIIFLDGYISSLNPIFNGIIPYWNDDIPTDEDSVLLINTLYEIKEKIPSLWFWD